MARIKSLRLNTLVGEKEITFIDGDISNVDGTHLTVITGRNGAHKSSILREIAERLIGPSSRNEIDTLKFWDDLVDSASVHVVACSGTPMDRFPSPEDRGIFTPFATPRYVYLGQRVGANMFSKRQLLETMLALSLGQGAAERFGWDFYRDVFALVGLEASVEVVLRHRSRGMGARINLPPLRERIVAAASGESGRRALVSPVMADYLLSNFDRPVFEKWEQQNKTRNARNLRLSLGAEPVSELDLQVIRLGLLCEELVVFSAKVVSLRTGKPFSLYELSSGEYSLLLNTLGIGFSVRDSSVVLIDEPENSLHPQWQIDFMKLLAGIAGKMKEGHFIISTHSPIIVSSINTSSTVVDVSRSGDASVETQPLSGAAADDILLNHFKVASSRNFFLVDKVQRAVAYVEEGNVDAPEFVELAESLKGFREKLGADDPFMDVIDAVLEFTKPAEQG